VAVELGDLGLHLRLARNAEALGVVGPEHLLRLGGVGLGERCGGEGLLGEAGALVGR